MIISNNVNTTPKPNLGSAVQYGAVQGSYGGYAPDINPVNHPIGAIPPPTENISSEQVVGFIPVFNCNSEDCRSGKYGSDDKDFMLPVFAQSQIGVAGDYYNDTNSFLFDFPTDTTLTSHDFFLDKKIDGIWEQQQPLNDNSMGYYNSIGSLCSALPYKGYKIYWGNVVSKYGEGVYRFRVGGSIQGGIVPSSGYIKLTSVTVDVTTIFSVLGYGDLCTAYFFDHTLSLNTLMQDYVIAINNYQNANYPTPLFVATWNAIKERIDITGLLGENGAILDNSTFKPNTYAVLGMDGGSNKPASDLNCYVSPPFCLKEWECNDVDRTTRFDAVYQGGVIGDVNKSNIGNEFSFCCNGIPIVSTDMQSYFDVYFKSPYTSFPLSADKTIDFFMGYGFDLTTTITFTAGMTITDMINFLVSSINTYQAGLGTPQFSAVVTGYAVARITCLSGQNLPVTIYTNTDIGTFIAISTYPAGYYPVYVDGTTEIQLTMTGGVDINAAISNKPIRWDDSIRIGGEFGYEQTDFERKSIKYQTGVVNKIRDEAILKFTWKSSSLPFWFHERFKAYGLMADELLVSDYNLNNNDYNIKLFPVQGDSSYNPDYKGYTRRSIVKCEFKAKTQDLKRTRCC